MVEVYRELPILFKGEMVRKIIAGQKHKTRRLKAPWNIGDHLWVRETFYSEGQLQATYPGDDTGVWVPTKNIWFASDGIPPVKGDNKWGLKNNGTPSNFIPSYGGLWWRKMPSIFMFRKYSRITLEVTEKYQEKLQDITDYECLEEGIEYREEDGSDIRDNFAKLWDSINRKRKVDITTDLKTVYPYSWYANPEVWVMGFKVLDIKGR
jgi:hypothetical protein